MDDYLGALQHYHNAHAHDPHVLEVSRFIIDYPFETRLFPHASQVVRRFKKWGKVVIVSDGDVVFQPRKIQRSGLWAAVEGRVLIYVHKERMLPAVAERYPARHYVMVDDKLRILAAMKEVLQQRLVTVFARQGHYANDPLELARHPAADIGVERIGDLLELDLAPWLGPASSTTSQENP